MILNKVFVSSFGNLKNYSQDFILGVNVIKEENGFGKSTLATFIKCMFYGITDGKKSIAENERVRFKPWNSTEKFGGYVVFTFKGQRYKLERYFGNKSSEDTVRLFDDETGKEYSNTDNLGYRLFDIDESGYFSTTYLSQNDFDVKGNSSITAKLNSNELSNGENAVDKALLKIEEKSKKYKALRGNAGLISDLKHYIFIKDEEIARAKSSLDTVSGLKQRYSELSAKEERLKKEHEALSEKLKESGKAEAFRLKRENLAVLKAELQKKKDEELEYDKTLFGENITDDELSALKTGVADALSNEKEKSVLESELASIPRTISETVRNKAVIYPYFIFLFLLVFGAVAIPLINLYIGVAAIVVSITGAVLYYVLSLKNRETTVEKESPKYAELYKKYSELSKVSEEYKTALNKFFSRFGLYDGSYDFRYEKLRSAKVGKDTTKKAVAELGERIEKIENELKAEDKGVADYDGNAVRYALKEKSEELNGVTSEMSRIAVQIGYNEENAVKLPILHEERDELDEKLKQANEDYEILNLTASYVKKADENLKKQYKAPLQESLDKFIGYLSGGKIKAIIDVDLKVSVEKDGKTFDTAYFSQGYRNLIDICKRFALSEVIFKNEKPFMILDDPFTNLDEEKIGSGAELLKKLAQDFQIVYLTCHDSRAF